MKIRDNESSLEQILQTITATVILHNFLIEENEEFDDSWYDLDDFNEDVGEAGLLEPGDELNEPAHHNSNLRREQLMSYFSEKNMI